MAAGACSYLDLARGKVTMRELFDMLLALDWNDHATAKARAMAERE